MLRIVTSRGVRGVQDIERLYWTWRFEKAGAGKLTIEAISELCCEAHNPLIFHKIDYAHEDRAQSTERVGPATKAGGRGA